MKTYYDLLGIPRTASADAIKSAYRRRLKQYHPDVAEDKQAAHEMTQQIIAAYEVLSDVQKRAAYDAQLRQALTVIEEKPAPPRKPHYREFAPIGLDFSREGWLVRLIVAFLILQLCAALLFAVGQ